MKLNLLAIEVLKQAGWYEGRNIFDKLTFLKQKDLFPEAQRIISKYGLLKVDFIGREPSVPVDTIYFDVDESRVSQLFRANMWGYNSPEAVNMKNDPDFLITEDYALTKLAIKKIGERCCYFGFHSDYTGFDLFVVPSGEIYVDHWESPIKGANSFEEYLNKSIKGVLKK